MIYWTLIVLGIAILSISLSNPFFNNAIKKYIKLNLFIEVIFRIFLFLLSVIVIILGLYLESVINIF